MNKTNQFGDILAVSLSFLCGIHCFAIPILLTILPSFKFLSETNVHLWIMVGIIPTSLISLVLGFNKHKNKSYLMTALIGLILLAFAAVWGDQIFGCENEKYVTLLGSSILSFAHIKNFLSCRGIDSRIYISKQTSDCCN